MRGFDLTNEGSKEPDFARGQLVRHRHYGYRGVVVEADRVCQAEETWYYGNRTQPGRNQPWYHVLVDGSNTATYAAQTSLEADDCTVPIVHPLIAVFFSEFNGQSHVRNDRPWPEASG